MSQKTAYADLQRCQNALEGNGYTLSFLFPVYEFGYGLTYSEIEEKWTDENTVELTNKGDFDTAYSVLKFENIPEIRFEGKDSKNPFAFKFYDAEKGVMGKNERNRYNKFGFVLNFYCKNGK